jgi:hypothetical protein
VINVARAAVVQYHTTNESAEHNQRLIEDVLAELAARDPGGLYYQLFRFDDGTTDPFARCAAYQQFHRDLGRRLVAPPTVMRAGLIGSYRSGCVDFA